MKTKMLIFSGLLLMSPAITQAEVTPDHLLQAIEEMSPEQVRSLHQTLRQKHSAAPTSKRHAKGKALDVGFSYSSFDTVNLSSVTQSGGNMNLDDVRGFDIGLLWRPAGERFLLGFRFGNWMANDSNLGEGGYTRADLKGGYFSVAANYQLVRSDAWILWAEVAPGFGNIDLKTIDTPNEAATTLRFFDGSFVQADLQAGISYRCRPHVTVFLSGGYRFAESINLEEGGRKSDLTFDASGFTGKWGIGFNF